MDSVVLVNVEVEKGGEILRILDNAGLKVKVALWAKFSEYQDWHLVLSSRRLDAAGPLESYGLVRNALVGAGYAIEETPPLMILSMTDPFIRALRKVFRKHRGAESLRLRWQLIGDRFVEDAYVYRIL